MLRGARGIPLASGGPTVLWPEYPRLWSDPDCDPPRLRLDPPLREGEAGDPSLAQPLGLCLGTIGAFASHPCTAAPPVRVPGAAGDAEQGVGVVEGGRGAAHAARPPGGRVVAGGRVGLKHEAAAPEVGQVRGALLAPVPPRHVAEQLPLQAQAAQEVLVPEAPRQPVLREYAAGGGLQARARLAGWGA